MPILLYFPQISYKKVFSIEEIIGAAMLVLKMLYKYININ